MGKACNFFIKVKNYFGNKPIQCSFFILIDNFCSLHCISFTRSSLSIGKNSAMITFDSFFNHMLNFAPFVDIFLIVLFREEIIKMKCPFCRIFNGTDLFFPLINDQTSIFITILNFRWQKRTNANRCFNLIRHSLIFYLTYYDYYNMYFIFLLYKD